LRRCLGHHCFWSRPGPCSQLFGDPAGAEPHPGGDLGRRDRDDSDASSAVR
jgi:hypothetical protein